jgi:hypothetical protein
MAVRYSILYYKRAQLSARLPRVLQQMSRLLEQRPNRHNGGGSAVPDHLARRYRRSHAAVPASVYHSPFG